MKQITFLILLLTFLISPSVSCTQELELIGSASATQATTLRVALFPYIPDSGGDNYDSLERFIESEFEKESRQEIDLILRPMDQNDNFYNLEDLKNWLAGDDQSALYDIIEVDTVLLGDLVAAGLIGPWENPPNQDDWHPVATRSVIVSEAVYGVPHLLCGHFIMSRSETVAKAASVYELSDSLKGLNNDRRDLVGNLLGSWNLPALYLDAWEDSHPRTSAAYALATPLDTEILQQLKKFSKLCEKDGYNPCLEGKFDDWEKPTLAADTFARGESDALFGYSERLHFVRRTAPKDSSVRISSAPIGKGSFPIVFTDAFVLRANVEERVRQAALAFVKFMNSPQIQEVVMMSQDTPSTSVPRYLIPATRSAFEVPSIKQDEYYTAIKKAISTSAPFPITGLLKTRKAMGKEILTFLKQ